MTFIKSLSVFMPEIMAKLTIRSTRDGGTEFFEILVGVLQGDTYALFLFIIALDYALETLLEKYMLRSCFHYGRALDR